MHAQLTCLDIKRQAQHLLQYFHENGYPDMKLGQAQNAIARSHGFKDWFTACSVLDQGAETPPAPPAELVPAHIPKFEKALLDLLARRLSDVGRHVDNSAPATFQPVLKKIDQFPRPAGIGEVMRELLPLIYAAHQQRIIAMRAVVAAVSAQHRLVGDELAQKAALLVTAQYPEKLFRPMMEKMPETFERLQRNFGTSVDTLGHQHGMAMYEVTTMNARDRGLRQLHRDLKAWQLTTNRADLEANLVHVVYATEAKKRTFDLPPGQLWQLAFESVEAALEAPMPPGVSQATMSVAGGHHVYRKGEWRFEPFNKRA